MGRRRDYGDTFDDPVRGSLSLHCEDCDRQNYPAGAEGLDTLYNPCFIYPAPLKNLISLSTALLYGKIGAEIGIFYPAGGYESISYLAVADV